jgi:DnaJ-class molecular chaperone
VFVQLHPDVNPQEDTTKEAAVLNEAYTVLQQVPMKRVLHGQGREARVFLACMLDEQP